MKKIILIILAILTIYLLTNKVKAEEVIIPDTAIRLRVITNSNSTYDQSMKQKVKSYLEDNVYTMFNDINNIEVAREKIKKELPNIEKNIDNIFIDNDYNMDFKVKYGMNYFPSKKYKGVTYNEGYYESLVVEIGEAKGDNWWCVLFPTICTLDNQNNDDVEYQVGIVELLKKIF